MMMIHQLNFQLKPDKIRKTMVSCKLSDQIFSCKNLNVFLVKTYYNKKYKKRNKNNIPYQGYQDPNEIDWSVYGPDRPGKRPKPDEEGFFSSIASDTQLISVASFFGLLLPGILGSLYFLGVPLTQVGFIFCDLEIQMHFLRCIWQESPFLLCIFWLEKARLLKMNHWQQRFSWTYYSWLMQSLQ